jgi:hypothetical protein
MLKRTVEKLEDVAEGVRAFYAPAGEGQAGFVLQVEGKPVEDTTALKNAKDHEKNLRIAAERERDAAKTALTQAETERTAAEEAARVAVAGKDQNVQSLEASWQAKLTAAEQARQADVAERDSEIERLLITGTAELLAAEISTVPELFSSVISRRLKVEVGADKKRFVRVLDDAGQPTADTVDDLRKNLLANEKYAAIIISGKGSGGGANKNPSGGGAAEKKYLEHSDTELSELRRTDKPKYDRLLAAHRAGEEAKQA